VEESVSNLVCVGLNSYIDYNYNENYKSFKSLVEEIKKYGDMRKILNQPIDQDLDFMTLYNLTDAYYSNIHMLNKNVTENMRLPDKIWDLLRNNFIHDLAYKVFYGDKDLYLAKVIVSPSFKTLLANFQETIDYEAKKFNKAVKKVNDPTNQKKGKAKKKLAAKLSNKFKFYMYFPEQEVFWGSVVFFAREIGKDFKIPLRASYIQFELIKNTTGFNMTKFMEEEEIYSDPSNPSYKKAH